MLRVPHCLDRLFELIRSGGSQLVLFQVFNCMHVPPPCLKLDFQSGRCPIASSVRFEVEELSLSPQAGTPYLLQWRTIVSTSQTLLITLFIGVKRQVKTYPILPRLHLTWDTSPRAAVLNYTTSGKFLDFQHTANTRFLSERKDKETDLKWFKVLLKLRCIDLILSIGIGSDTGIFCWIVYRSDETDPNPILSEDYSVLLLSPKRGTKTL